MPELAGSEEAESKKRKRDYTDGTKSGPVSEEEEGSEKKEPTPKKLAKS